MAMIGIRCATRLLALTAGIALVGIPSAASAATGTSTVTGVASSALSVVVPATVTSAGVLTPGSSTSFTASAVAVVAPGGSWSLTVADATNSGVLQKGGAGNCANSPTSLAAPLRFTSSAVTGSGQGSSTAVGGSAVAVATGGATNFLDTVTATFTQAVGSSEALAAGCNYSTTITYTLA